MPSFSNWTTSSATTSNWTVNYINQYYDFNPLPPRPRPVIQEHVVDSDGIHRYYDTYGMSHREDGPAVIDAKGNQWWYRHGQEHREDGPSWISVNGDKWWKIKGRYHREDGPAVEYANGTTEWWINGRRHREDGPAFVHADGITKQWWIRGRQIQVPSQQAFLQYMHADRYL